MVLVESDHLIERLLSSVCLNQPIYSNDPIES